MLKCICPFQRRESTRHEMAFGRLSSIMVNWRSKTSQGNSAQEQLYLCVYKSYNSLGVNDRELQMSEL